MTSIVIELPFPPSANGLYRNATSRDGKPRGRIITERYQTWLNAAGWSLKSQRPQSISGPVALNIALGRPMNRDGTPNKTRRDLDNLSKAIQDLLVKHKIIEDDSLIHDLRVHWARGVKGALITVSPAAET